MCLRTDGRPCALDCHGQMGPVKADLNLPSGSHPVSPSTASAPHHTKWRLTGPFQAEELRNECWKEAAAKREDVKIH